MTLQLDDWLTLRSCGCWLAVDLRSVLSRRPGPKRAPLVRVEVEADAGGVAPATAQPRRRRKRSNARGDKESRQGERGGERSLILACQTLIQTPRLIYPFFSPSHSYLAPSRLKRGLAHLYRLTLNQDGAKNDYILLTLADSEVEV